MSYFYQKISKFKPTKKSIQSKKTIFILFDQLSEFHSLITDPKKEILIFIETSAKPKLRNYHKQKLVLLLTSMREFALEKANSGFEIIYHYSDNFYDEAILEIKTKFQLDQIFLLEPSEWEIGSKLEKLNFLEIITNELFLIQENEFDQIFKDKKKYLLETFYRYMRKKYNILMDNEKPIGGKWNFDDENREVFKYKDLVPISNFKKNNSKILNEVIELVNSKYKNHIGSTEIFFYATTRTEALEWLNQFIENYLPLFGKYEDAISIQYPFLFHSLLSPYLNLGLLTPIECIQAAIQSYTKKKSPLNSVEGFIRQILGWREYMRMVYLKNKIKYQELNYFNHKYHLPEFYYKGNSGMFCIDDTVKNLNQFAYSHHITRLMILSNLANLLNINPKELNNWFWEIYIDAYEWVVTPNVIGMGLYADGGIISTKPYIASANYIKKMGPELCKSCKYNPEKTFEENACPFNSLYWNFISDKEEFYKSGSRDYSYLNLKKMDKKKLEMIKTKAKNIKKEFLKI